MTASPSDSDLKALFLSLRDEDARSAPDFRRLWPASEAGGKGVGEGEWTGESAAAAPGAWEVREAVRGRRPRIAWEARPALGRRGLRIAWVGGVLAAAAAAAFLYFQAPAASDREFEQVVRSYAQDPALGAWRSPTDALLKLPGSELLSTRPAVGDRRWPAAPRPHSS